MWREKTEIKGKLIALSRDVKGYCEKEKKTNKEKKHSHSLKRRMFDVMINLRKGNTNRTLTQH